MRWRPGLTSAQPPPSLYFTKHNKTLNLEKAFSRAERMHVHGTDKLQEESSAKKKTKQIKTMMIPPQRHRDFRVVLASAKVSRQVRDWTQMSVNSIYQTKCPNQPKPLLLCIFFNFISYVLIYSLNSLRYSASSWGFLAFSWFWTILELLFNLEGFVSVLQTQTCKPKKN